MTENSNTLDVDWGMAIYPHQIKDGFLDVDIISWKDEIVEHLSRRVVDMARNISERRTNELSMEKVFRCSRMCWELIVNSKMTDLDMTDVEILLSLPLNVSSGTEMLFNTLNAVKPLVLKSELDPKTIHSASMSLTRSMTS